MDGAAAVMRVLRHAGARGVRYRDSRGATTPHDRPYDAASISIPISCLSFEAYYGVDALFGSVFNSFSIDSYNSS
jgi:hypothetical protein